VVVLADAGTRGAIPLDVGDMMDSHSREKEKRKRMFRATKRTKRAGADLAARPTMYAIGGEQGRMRSWGDSTLQKRASREEKHQQSEGQRLQRAQSLDRELPSWA
jgi:hypothetical protein